MTRQQKGKKDAAAWIYVIGDAIGGGVGGAWLTEKGEKVLEDLEEITKNFEEEE